MLFRKLSGLWCIVSASLALTSCHSVPPQSVSSPERQVYFNGATLVQGNGSPSRYHCRVMNLHTNVVYQGAALERNNALKQARSSCLAGQQPQSCSLKFDCQYLGGSQ